LVRPGGPRRSCGGHDSTIRVPNETPPCRSCALLVNLRYDRCAGAGRHRLCQPRRPAGTGLARPGRAAQTAVLEQVGQVHPTPRCLPRGPTPPVRPPSGSARPSGRSGPAGARRAAPRTGSDRLRPTYPPGSAAPCWPAGWTAAHLVAGVLHQQPPRGPRQLHRHSFPGDTGAWSAGARISANETARRPHVAPNSGGRSGFGLTRGLTRDISKPSPPDPVCGFVRGFLWFGAFFMSIMDGCVLVVCSGALNGFRPRPWHGFGVACRIALALLMLMSGRSTVTPWRRASSTSDCGE
jgi:hypothetical protein